VFLIWVSSARCERRHSEGGGYVLQLGQEVLGQGLDNGTLTVKLGSRTLVSGSDAREGCIHAAVDLSNGGVNVSELPGVL
jgi:hypothetical protein